MKFIRRRVKYIYDDEDLELLSDGEIVTMGDVGSGKTEKIEWHYVDKKGTRIPVKDSYVPALERRYQRDIKNS